MAIVFDKEWRLIYKEFKAGPLVLHNTSVIWVRDALTKLLTLGSKAIRLAAESALAQAKETKRRPDPEGLKSLLRRNWTVDRAAKHWENRLMLLNQLGGLSTMNVDAMENIDLLHPKWAAEVMAFMQPQQTDNLSVDGMAIEIPALCLLFAHVDCCGCGLLLTVQ